MARTETHEEAWDIPGDTNQWDAIRAADAYLRVRLGLGKYCHAGVFDDRGRIFENTLTAAYREWRKEQNSLESVVISYGRTDDALHAKLLAQDLHLDPAASTHPPKLRISVGGTDAAEVRGIALETIRKAQRGIVVPAVEVSDLNESLAITAVTPQPTTDSIDQALATSRAEALLKILNSPWVVTVGGAIVAALIIFWITS